MGLSERDYAQVLKLVYDESTQSLRTTGVGGSLIITHADDSIRLGDGVDLVTSTTVGADVGLDVNIIGGVVSGTFTNTGLSTNLKATKVTITDVATKVPTTPLANRNGLTVRVWNPGDTSIVVYFGNSTVTATDGYPLLHGESFQIDIKDNASVELYAICEAGKSALVRVLEVA